MSSPANYQFEKYMGNQTSADFMVIRSYVYSPKRRFIVYERAYLQNDKEVSTDRLASPTAEIQSPPSSPDHAATRR